MSDMDTKDQLKLSLEIAENAKAYCRKVYGENYSKNDLSIITQAMIHGAKIGIEHLERDTIKEFRKPAYKAKVFSIIRGGEK